jgi:hypothetical protein
MTLAIRQRDSGDMMVLDAVRERRSPFSTEDVIAEFSQLLWSIPLSGSPATDTPESGLGSLKSCAVTNFRDYLSIVRRLSVVRTRYFAPNSSPPWWLAQAACLPRPRQHGEPTNSLTDHRHEVRQIVSPGHLNL